MIAEFIDPAILGFILVGVMLFAIFVGFPICLYGNNDGTSWINGKIILSISDDVS